MPKVYDDWDRLVRATVRRQELWELCHAPSRTTSGGSTTSGGTPGSTSPINEEVAAGVVGAPAIGARKFVQHQTLTVAAVTRSLPAVAPAYFSDGRDDSIRLPGNSDADDLVHLEDYIYVNDKPLTMEELIMLQSCPNPPKKLRPGKYWYDKVSGFWGKEGEKPSQVISPLLKVGYQIKSDASNGNTDVLINGREITKLELLMLRLAGVHCEGRPHFWVFADGSYQYEGMNNIIGKLWERKLVRALCVALSLPFRSHSENTGDEDVNVYSDKVNLRNLEKNLMDKLLLVGGDQSGTSTIFKQAKILHSVPFLEDEKQNIKIMIQRNLYRYIGILLDGRERFREDRVMEIRRQCANDPGPSVIPDQINEEKPFTFSPRLEAFSSWLLQIMVSGNLEAIFPAATREYSPLVEELWKEEAFQAIYKRRNELPMLPRVANYFLDRAVQISRFDYEPSEMDILYSEGVPSSNGVASMEFSVSKSSQDGFMESLDQNEPSGRLLVSIGPNLPSFFMPMSNTEKERLESVEQSLEQLRKSQVDTDAKLSSLTTSIQDILATLKAKHVAPAAAPAVAAAVAPAAAAAAPAAASTSRSSPADDQVSGTTTALPPPASHVPPLPLADAAASSSRGVPADEQESGTTSAVSPLAPPIPALQQIHPAPPYPFHGPRIELPSFDGKDPVAWLGQAAQFFMVHKSVATDRITIALAAMTSRAMFWAQGVLRRDCMLTWERFSRELIERFGDTLARNVYESMHVTRQTGGFQHSIRDRITEPESMACHKVELSQPSWHRPVS